MKASRVRVADVNLHVVDEGSGPPVLLLHGFPDSSRLWRHQIPALVDAGFRAIAPDLRGFGESDKPTQMEAYSLPLVLEEIVRLLDALGIHRTNVVGHDWGAAIGWLLASHYPGRVYRLMAVSLGHPHTFYTAGLDQRERSWYTLLFQFRGIAEELLTRDDWRFFREWARHHPETDSWIRDLARPGALTAALNWYRANAGPQGLLTPPAPAPRVLAPTLALWSAWDAYVSEAQVAGSGSHVSGPWRYERLEGATHWIPLDRPDYVNLRLMEFLCHATRECMSVLV
jgi:pimeloyl-ACP methyl ester carboxylesterase